MPYQLSDKFIKDLSELLIVNANEKQINYLISRLKFKGYMLTPSAFENILKNRIKNYTGEKSKNSKVCRILLKDIILQIREDYPWLFKRSKTIDTPDNKE